MSFHWLRWPAGAAALAVCFAVIIGPALAVDVQHGISFTKGCASPTSIGAPYSCSYTVQNNVDDAQDTLTITGLVDVVHAASGNLNSGNILGLVRITTTGGATCAAASGDGGATPYMGVTSCTLPFGSKVNVLSYSDYTVTAGDFALTGHVLRDDAFLTWHDLCTNPAGQGNCAPNPPDASSASQSLITPTVDANIQITPATADNPVGTTHTLTGHVNVDPGTGFVNAPSGTLITFSKVSGPGTFVGNVNTCTTIGATGSCTVVITSTDAGTTVVRASTTVTVAGVSLTRTTNDGKAGDSGDANKNWIPTLADGRVTGGGSIFATVGGKPNVRITHGFELRCDPTDKRQSLEINWDGGNNFHLDKLINSVTCFDDPSTQPPPPPGTVIDTYAGATLFNGHAGYHGYGYAVGTGTCNKLPATIYFILTDAGEPGTADVAEYHIVGGCTLDAGPATLDKGNHQFHKH